MDLETKAADIKTRSDLAGFVDMLADDLKANGEEWGHQTLDGFLTVLAGSIRVLDRIYKNEGKQFSEDHQWRVFAEMLLAAKVRE